MIQKYSIPKLIFLILFIHSFQLNAGNDVKLTKRDIDERILAGLTLNIKWFGATGTSSNDTDAFKNAIDYLNSTNCASLFIPSGIYIVSPSIIKLKKSCKIFGDGKSSIIKPDNNHRAKEQKNAAGIEILSSGCIIEDIQIRDYAIGIKWNKLQQINIIRCHIFQNSIGIHCTDAYINNISNNYLTFNNIGIVSLGQSYQLLIISNVIDNNISIIKGGIGIFLSGSNGCEIRSNTIEGNRNMKKGAGCGIYIAGVCTKLNIIGNWFEINFEKDNINTNIGVDIYCANGMDNYISDKHQSKLIENIIPDELVSYAINTAYGSLNIRDNIHISTPFAIILSYFHYGRVSISGQIFTGDNRFLNKPIYLRNNLNRFYNTVINLYDNREQNTYGNTANITRNMLSGINNSLLFLESNFQATGNLTINYDGNLIYKNQ